MRFRPYALLTSRPVMALGVVLAIAVPALTLPRLPHVSPWPALLGLAPWVVGKYVLCPLRWRALTAEKQTRGWHIRAFAESELLGLLTPGHVGADVWRFRRLTTAGLGRGDALTSIGLDRLVGAVGVTAFVVFAGPSVPPQLLVVALAVGAAALVAALVVGHLRPGWLPARSLPAPLQLVHGLVLAAAYQLTIACLLLGTVASTGHPLPPMALLAAFGASQLAGAVPGPNGASPRDGALIVALVALGLPWIAAAAAVTLKAALAWLPALALGGVSLLLTNRAARAAATAAAGPAIA